MKLKETAWGIVGAAAEFCAAGCLGACLYFVVYDRHLYPWLGAFILLALISRFARRKAGAAPTITLIGTDDSSMYRRLFHYKQKGSNP